MIRGRMGTWLVLACVALQWSACRNEPAAQEADSATAPSEGTARPPLNTSRRLIDTHTHFFGPNSWALVGPVMRAENIEFAVNLSGGSPREGMTEALQLARDSGGRVLNAMTIDWNGFGEPAWGEIEAEELSLCVTRYGYAGLKVSKALGLFIQDLDGTLIDVDDPRLFPLWERAGELGVPVFIHVGDPAAFWLPVTPENERFDELRAHPNWSFAEPGYPTREALLTQLEHLFQEFPETTWVGLHFGNNPEDIDYVDRLLARFPNVYIDIAARVPEIGRNDPARMRDFFTRWPDRVFFATDLALGESQRRGTIVVLGSSGEETATPDQVPEFFARHYEYFETGHADIAHPTPIQGRWTVDAIALPPDVLDRLYYQNAYDVIVAPWLARNPDAVTEGTGAP